MRVAVVGNHSGFIEKDLPKYGLQLSKANPDVVVSYGGDGTILVSERKYPGIPKIFIRHSALCVKCQSDKHSKFLKLLGKKRFRIMEEIKVEGHANGKKLVGMNEINIVSSKPIYAVRFDVSVDGKTIARNVIGDGILVSTPYGSNAYYHSIARRVFKKGLGIAFNNPRQKMKNIVVSENSVIKVKILRDGAWMITDNNPKFIALRAGDVVTIKKHPRPSKIIKL